MAFLSGWSYRKPVTLSRASGAVTNYQMKLKVGESSGAAGEDVDCGALCKTDFSDLRFTAADGTTLLDYYIEDVSGTTPNQLATVWIEFDSIGTGATTFYMYYGNAGASAVSNGPNTFILFEDFNALTTGDLAGQNGWSAGANVLFDVQTSVVKEGAKALGVGVITDGGTAYKTIPGNTWNIWIEAWIRATNAATTNSSMLNVSEGTTEISGLEIGQNAIEHLFGSSPYWTSVGVAASANTWYKVKFAFNAKTSHLIWVNDTPYTPANLSNYNSITTKVDRVYFRRWSGVAGTSAYCDVIKIGQYLATEPAWGSWGAEEPALNHYTLELEPASFSMTGAAVRLLNNKSFIAGPGAFSMIGKNIGMPKALVPFSLEPGAFAMTGAALSIRRPVSYMRMDPGAFSMIGKPVDVKYHWYSGEAGSNYEFQKQRRKF